MPKRPHQPVIKLDDAEENTLHAVWSRAGNLIVSVAPRGTFGRDWAGQVVLTSDQVDALKRFWPRGRSSAQSGCTREHSSMEAPPRSSVVTGTRCPSPR